MEQEQITLGELIKLLEPIAEREAEEGSKSDKEQATVVFDFGSAVPTGLSSWRGVYSHLAVNYSFNGYGYMVGYKKEDGSTFDPKPPTVNEFLSMLKEAIGKTYTGWKGGDFEMGNKTPLWVSNDGDGDDTAVVGVIDKGYKVIIQTSFWEY